MIRKGIYYLNPYMTYGTFNDEFGVNAPVRRVGSTHNLLGAGFYNNKLFFNELTDDYYTGAINVFDFTTNSFINEDWYALEFLSDYTFSNSDEETFFNTVLINAGTQLTTTDYSLNILNFTPNITKKNIGGNISELIYYVADIDSYYNTFSAGGISFRYIKLNFETQSIFLGNDSVEIEIYRNGWIDEYSSIFTNLSVNGCYWSFYRLISAISKGGAQGSISVSITYNEGSKTLDIIASGGGVSKYNLWRVEGNNYTLLFSRSNGHFENLQLERGIYFASVTPTNEYWYYDNSFSSRIIIANLNPPIVGNELIDDNGKYVEIFEPNSIDTFFEVYQYIGDNPIKVADLVQSNGQPVKYYVASTGIFYAVTVDAIYGSSEHSENFTIESTPTKLTMDLDIYTGILSIYATHGAFSEITISRDGADFLPITNAVRGETDVFIMELTSGGTYAISTYVIRATFERPALPEPIVIATVLDTPTLTGVRGNPNLLEWNEVDSAMEYEILLNGEVVDRIVVQPNRSRSIARVKKFEVR